MNKGKYLEESLLDAEPTNFCVGVSGYPEKHYEAPNLETDIKHIKAKIDAGADYIVTQMFYDNKKYYEFVDKCRAAGINVPIIPGLKILTAKNHVSSLPKNFYIDIPNELADNIIREKSEHTMDIGVEWTLKQAEDLLNHNVPALHFYVMQTSNPINKLMAKLKL